MHHDETWLTTLGSASTSTSTVNSTCISLNLAVKVATGMMSRGGSIIAVLCFSPILPDCLRSRCRVLCGEEGWLIDRILPPS